MICCPILTFSNVDCFNNLCELVVLEKLKNPMQLKAADLADDVVLMLARMCGSR